MAQCGGEPCDQRGAVKAINPFSSIVPESQDKTRRLPLADADMKAIKRNLPAR